MPPGKVILVELYPPERAISRHRKYTPSQSNKAYGTILRWYHQSLGALRIYKIPFDFVEQDSLVSHTEVLARIDAAAPNERSHIMTYLNHLAKRRRREHMA